MKRIALNKALTRLEVARAALASAVCSRSYPEFEQSWTNFLIHLNNIHSALYKGSRSNPEAEAWFGRRKHERRTDPLLRYIQQARNADEHGIEPISRLDPGGIGMGGTSGAVHIDELRIDKTGKITVKGLRDTGGGRPFVEVQAASAKLVPVTDDRFGDTFYPPTEHLGKPLPETTPVVVGTLALSYHEAMLEEAKKFCV